MKYSAVIFDLDGTLLDTIGDLTASINHTMKKYGFPCRSVEEVRSFVGNGVANLVSRCLPEETDSELFSECLSSFKSHYKEHAAELTQPYEGIRELLTSLKSMNIRTAVVSNKVHDTSSLIIDRYFGSLIDVTIGQRDSFPKKPDPYGTLEAIRLLNCRPEECIYVGDSEVDCKTGHNAGLQVIGVSWGFRGRDVLTDNGADFIVDNASDILTIVANP